MDYGLKNKRAFVTGAADGCGAAIARVLDAEGCVLILSDLPSKEDKLEAVCKPLRSAEYITADLSLADNVRELWKKCGAVDILVNNAGIWPTAYVRDMTAEAFKLTLDINLIAPFILCREFVNASIAAGRRGKIVNMVSQAAFHGSTSGHAHYAASKAGLVGFTVSLAREAAPRGINVNAVAPGMMRTPMNRDALNERGGDYISRIPLGRIAEPEEVAYAVAFLCGDKSDYITGATLDVTGGMLMR